MTEHELNATDNGGMYPEGKVYWQDGHGWTSRLWQRLATMGWSTHKTPAGFTLVINPGGQVVVRGWLSRAFALLELAKVMR